MLDRSSWEQHTKHLPEGRRLRVDHDCGPGRTLIVENKDEGFTAYCFRCSDHGFIPHPAPSLSERLAKLERVRSVETKLSGSPALPEPMTTDPQLWPDSARVWLYKAGLSNDDIQAARFYYHEPTQRVVLPVYDGERCVYWQARALDGRQPKYLNPLVDRSNVAAKYGSGPVLVLTEDILSAYRTARVTEAWSLLGTKLPDGVAVQIVVANKPVVVMLDPDKAGQAGNARIYKALKSYGIEARVVVPRRDPKYLTKEELLCLLGLAPTAPSPAVSTRSAACARAPGPRPPAGILSR